jgi:hypothetical protein
MFTFLVVDLGSAFLILSWWVFFFSPCMCVCDLCLIVYRLSSIPLYI